MKNPSATPRICVERRFGPPIRSPPSRPRRSPRSGCSCRPSAASHASANSTSSERRRSSAQRRFFDSAGARACTHCAPAQRQLRPQPRISAAAAVTSSRRRARACGAREGCSTIGTEMIVTTSAIVTCAITSITGRPSSSALLDRRQQHRGRARGEHDRVDRRVAAARDERARAGRRAPRAAQRVPRAARPGAARIASRGSRSGRCMPTVSISIAKPTSAGTAIVGCVRVDGAEHGSGRRGSRRRSRPRPRARSSRRASRAAGRRGPPARSRAAFRSRRPLRPPSSRPDQVAPFEGPDRRRARRTRDREHRERRRPRGAAARGPGRRAGRARASSSQRGALRSWPNSATRTPAPPGRRRRRVLARGSVREQQRSDAEEQQRDGQRSWRPPRASLTATRRRAGRSRPARRACPRRARSQRARRRARAADARPATARDRPAARTTSPGAPSASSARAAADLRAGEQAHGEHEEQEREPDVSGGLRDRHRPELLQLALQVAGDARRGDARRDRAR